MLTHLVRVEVGGRSGYRFLTNPDGQGAVSRLGRMLGVRAVCNFCYFCYFLNNFGLLMQGWVGTTQLHQGSLLDADSEVGQEMNQ